MRPLNEFIGEGNVSSQAGQDGVLAEIMRRLKVEHGSCLEFGAGDGIRNSNTYQFYRRGWDCAYIEAGNHYPQLVENTPDARHCQKLITCEPGDTLDDAIAQMGIPQDLTLMSLDIDSIDYWVWKSLKSRQPLVVCIEYNSNFEPDEHRTVAYEIGLRWRNDDRYYGASAGALYALAIQKGYVLVAFLPGNDLIFLRADVYTAHQDRFDELPVTQVVKTPLHRDRTGRRMVEPT